MRLDAAELELFQQQLLKNFSPQSLMENLTILNPARLLDCVYEAVSALQRQMNRRFQSRTLVGIYIHVSFLIERLVTRTAIESLADLDAVCPGSPRFHRTGQRQLRTAA